MTLLNYLLAICKLDNFFSLIEGRGGWKNPLTYVFQPSCFAYLINKSAHSNVSFRSAAQSGIDCLASFDSLAETSSASSSGAQTAALTLPSQKMRHLRFLDYTQSAVLGYCCKLITSLLQELGTGDYSRWLWDTILGRLVLVFGKWTDQNLTFNFS